MKSRLYFAYGGNIDLDCMKKRCPNAQEVGIYELKDWQFFIMEYHYASVRKKGHTSVFGVIWNITLSDEVELDRYEGFPHYYIKESFVLSSGEECFMYVATAINEGIPDAEYFKRIITSAHERNFPKDYIHELESWIQFS